MRAPLTPIKAFVHDAAALGKGGSTGAADDSRLSQWLLVAQSAERLAELKPEQRDDYVRMLVSSVLPPREGRPTQIEGDGRVPATPIVALAERLRMEAEDMERATCFELALATVSAVCQMLARGKESLTARLLATAHLGRVVRQLGDYNSAVDIYNTVTSEGEERKDGPVAAHGYIGLGNIAHSRGNRPAQKSFFQKALDLAARGSPVELSAHQGLVIVANLEGALADALLHGWRAHDLAPPESEMQLETVNNLSYTALLAGFNSAALSGFEYVVQHARQPRHRLPSITGAVRASGRLSDIPRLDKFQQLGHREVDRTPNPFESATFFFWASIARSEVGHDELSRPLMVRCLELADKFGLFELRVKAEDFMNAPVKQRTLSHTESAFLADDDNPIVVESISRLEALSAV